MIFNIQFVVALLVILLIVVIAKHLKYRQIINKIPGPDGIPFIGELEVLKLDAGGQYTSTTLNSSWIA